MSTPDWVSIDLIQDALRSYFGNKGIQIMGYTSSAAVAAGDNYTSDLFRSVVTYRPDKNGNQNSISIIIKCSPVGKEQMMELTKQTKLFKREIEMYSAILPAVYDALGEDYTLSAKFIYYTEEPYALLIFEDLSKAGFKMHDRQTGCDLQHCLLVIEKLATFHAASVVLHEKNPGLYKEFNKSIFADNEMTAAWMAQAFDSFIKASSTWPGLEKYGRKLQAMMDKIVERTVNAATHKLGGFRVLNHGDAWVNNILFLYDNQGKLKDCKFVDYQLVLFSSPVVDLHYFWATSPTIEVRRNHFNTVFERYYSKFIYTLTSLNYSLERVPTKKELLEDWVTRSFYGLFASVGILPLIKANSRSDASFDDLIANDDEDGFRHHVYNNERYRKEMEYLLPFYDNLGAFD